MITSPSNDTPRHDGNDALALTLADLADALQSREGEVLPSGRTVGDVLSDIASKKHIMGTLPPCRDDDGAFVLRSEREGLSAKMVELQGLYEMVEELEMLAERMRVEDVVRRHHELHPLLMMDCCICFESMPFTDIGLEHFLPCCGNNICQKCMRSSMEGGEMRLTKCPCCRFSLMCGAEAYIPLLETQAAKGKSWAQTQIGIYYLQGSSCEHGDAVTHKVDGKEALKWFKLAAEQRQADAIRIIAQIQYGLYGDIEGAEICNVKARSTFKDAADLGNLRAQRNYAMMCRLGEGGPVDEAEAAHYYTLAYAQKSRMEDQFKENYEEIVHAARFLGCYYYDGSGGLRTNLYRARCYLAEGISPEIRDAADVYLAACLIRLHGIHFGRCGLGQDSFAVDDYSVPGYSPVPRALALYTKSASKLGDEHSVMKGMLKQLEASVKSLCANCGKGEDDVPDLASRPHPDGKLKTCVRCRSMCYCSKDCQVQHWKAGHKTDCVKFDLMVPGMQLFYKKCKEEMLLAMQMAAREQSLRNRGILE